VPVAVYVLCLYGLYTLLSREGDPFHLWLIAGTSVVIIVAIAMAAANAPIAACLLVLALAPTVTVVGYEFVGYRHRAEMLDRSTRP
jgi:hypothetical protein